MTDAKRGWQSTVLVPVFAPAVIVTLLLVIGTISNPELAGSLFSSTLAYITETFGWFYMLGQYSPRARSRRAAVQLPGLVRHAVFRRLRHRPAVLWRRRTGHPLCQPAGGRPGDAGCRQAGDADRLFPLGLSYLGDLRAGRPGTGLLCLSPWPPAVDAFSALSADW